MSTTIALSCHKCFDSCPSKLFLVRQEQKGTLIYEKKTCSTSTRTCKQTD
jgi:hypothetical protein